MPAAIFLTKNRCPSPRIRRETFCGKKKRLPHSPLPSARARIIQICSAMTSACARPAAANGGQASDPDLDDIADLDEDEMKRSFFEKAPKEIPSEILPELFEVAKESFFRGEDPMEILSQILLEDVPSEKTRRAEKRRRTGAGNGREPDIGCGVRCRRRRNPRRLFKQGEGIPAGPAPAEFEKIRDAYEAMRDPRRRARAMFSAGESNAPLVSLIEGRGVPRIFAGPQAWREVLKNK